MPKLKITKSNMIEIVKPVSGQVDYYDTDLKGFGVRATKEVFTFFVYKRIRGQERKVFIPIGIYGTFTPEQARNKAKEYIRDLDTGKNPHPKNNLEPVETTIADLYRQYISGKKTPLSDSTVYAYDSWMKNHFSDWLALPADMLEAGAHRCD